MTLVDPFIPVKKTPLPGLTNNVPRFQQELPVAQSAVRPSQPLRQVQPKLASQPHPPAQRPVPMRRPAQKPLVTNTVAAQPHPAPAATGTVTPLTESAKPVKKQRRFALVGKLRLLILPVVLIGGGILLQSVLFGQLCILAYAIYAFIRRIPSSTTLTLAGISFLGIVLLMAVKPFSSLIGTFAIYAFLLLVVGIASLVREIYNQDKGAART